MLASFLKRDLKNLIQRDASPNFQVQNGLLSIRSWWRSVRSLKDSTAKASVVDKIFEFNRDREPKLVRRKFRRMTKDPFAFFRGTDQLFATHWTRLAPPDVAPSVLICGDLHLENYGAYRTDEGYFLFLAAHGNRVIPGATATSRARPRHTTVRRFMGPVLVR